MGVILSVVNASLEDLLETEKQLQIAINEKRKEIALAKSGWVVKDNPVVDVEHFVAVEDPADILFINWFVKVKLGYKGDLPKYLHKCTRKDIPETTYIYAGERNPILISAGNKTAVTIHEDSIPYLMEEYREWSWTAI